MLLFTADDHARVASGEITVTWRLWKYAHVKAGRVYASGFGGGIEVEDVRPVRAADISDSDAREVGLSDARSLIDFARSHTGREVSGETTLYRVQFRYLRDAPQKPSLSLAEVAARLDRLDRASKRGAWTLQTLRLIEASPGVAARLLAPDAGLPAPDFKVSVRKLKALGLTISLEIGYELSELGQAYLDSVPD